MKRDGPCSIHILKMSSGKRSYLLWGEVNCAREAPETRMTSSYTGICV